MTQIGELAFKTKFDGRALTQGLMSTRKQITFARTEMEAMKTPAQRFADSVDNINKMIAKYPALESNRIKYMKQATLATLEQAESVRKLTLAERVRMNSLRGSLGVKSEKPGMLSSLAGATGLSAGAIGGGAVTAIAGRSVMAAAEAKKQEALLGVLTQSRVQGELLNKELRTMSQKGLKLSGLQESAKLLLTFGVETKKITPMLGRLGDVALGDTERMKGLSLAFGQAIGATRLMAEERNQMIERGFDPLSALSKATGQSMTELKKLMSEGKFTVDMLEQSLIAATTAGGRFNGGMAEASKGMAGAFNRMSADLDNLKIKFGDALGPAAETLATGLSKSLPVLNSMIEGVGKLASGFKTAAEFAGKLAPEGTGAAISNMANPIMNGLSVAPDLVTTFTAKARGLDEGVGMDAADRLRGTLGKSFFTEDNNKRIDAFKKSRTEKQMADEEKRLAPQREKEAQAKRDAERKQKETDRASAVNNLTSGLSQQRDVETWNMANPNLKASSADEVKTLRSMNAEERNRLSILTAQSELVEKLKDDQKKLQELMKFGSNMGQGQQAEWFRMQVGKVDTQAKQKAEQDKNKLAGDAVRERNMTPAEKFRKQFDEVGRLQGVGAIDAATGMRERMNIQGQMQQQITAMQAPLVPQDLLYGGGSQARSMSSGSAEAAKYMDSLKSLQDGSHDKVNKADPQLKELEKQLTEMKQQTKLLQDIKDTSPKKIRK